MTKSGILICSTTEHERLFAIKESNYPAVEHVLLLNQNQLAGRQIPSVPGLGLRCVGFPTLERATRLTCAPASRGESSFQLPTSCVNFVQNKCILCKNCGTGNHICSIIEGEHVGILGGKP